MYKTIVFLFLGLYSMNIYGQELINTQKVDKDSISIKWLPANFEQYQRIAIEGAQIVRIAASKNTTYESLISQMEKNGPSQLQKNALISLTPKIQKRRNKSHYSRRYMKTIYLKHF